jgi:hypothetical protein
MKKNPRIEPNIKRKTVEVSASWALDMIKGSSIDALAVTCAVAGPWLLPEIVGNGIRDNGWAAFLSTYAIYAYARYKSYRSDVELQNLTGINTNAWGKSVQTLCEACATLVRSDYFKKNDQTVWFQRGGEIAKFVRDEAVFVVPTFLYGQYINQTWESLTMLNVGAIVGYGARIGIQEIPYVKKLITNIDKKR